MQESPSYESFADGNVEAGVRLMVKGVCLSVRGSERRTWKYDDDKCRCGLVETEKRVIRMHFIWRRKTKMERGCNGFERWYGGI